MRRIRRVAVAIFVVLAVGLTSAPHSTNDSMLGWDEVFAASKTCKSTSSSDLRVDFATENRSSEPYVVDFVVKGRPFLSLYREQGEYDATYNKVGGVGRLYMTNVVKPGDTDDKSANESERSERKFTALKGANNFLKEAGCI